MRDCILAQPEMLKEYGAALDEIARLTPVVEAAVALAPFLSYPRPNSEVQSRFAAEAHLLAAVDALTTPVQPDTAHEGEK